ncbi:hypothetical protein [Vreelandella zhaodongensis]|uniref:hypothetical protein n=1 Tax=Vreelandella zhaodongensis TaxID=1176240 RepID=UPI003EBB6A1F
MDNKIVELYRGVSVSGERVKAYTDKLENVEYAFYFICKDQVEKKYYSPSSEVEFYLRPDARFFSVIYYYRLQDGEIVSLKRDYFRRGDEVKAAEFDTIYESDDNKIIHYDLGAETTFVVFNGTKSTKKSMPFGLSFLLTRGYNVISCLQDNDTQYQSLSFDDFRSAVLPAIESKKTICYGSSLGGYCAIYYAGAINASVIAAAPRNSAHPDLVRKKKGKSHFSPSLYKHSSIGKNALTEKSITIILDPYHLADVDFYRKYIRSFYKENIQLIEIPHAGHEVLYYLRDTRQLSGLISSVVNEQSYDINTALDSKYTDVGLVRHWLSIGDIEKARFYAQRAQSAGDLGKNFERRLKTLSANL